MALTVFETGVTLFSARNGQFYDNNPMTEAANFIYGWFYQLWLGLLWLFNQTPVQWTFWPRFAVMVLVILAVPFTLGLVMGRIRKAIFGMGNTYGRARFAKLRDVKRAGLIGISGRFLGTIRQRGIHLRGEGHILTMAAQGSGKTVGVVIPTLMSTETTTVIVSDPKGAVTAQTQAYRSRYSEVIILNPWGNELKNDPNFGLDLEDAGFNPLQQVSFSEEGFSAASALAGLILPDIPGETAYFREEGRELLEWVFLFQAAFLDPQKQTFTHAYTALYGATALLAAMEEIAKTTTSGPKQQRLKPGAERFLALAKGGPAQFMGIMGTAATALKIYAPGTALARHVSPAKGKGFQLADLKSKTLTVYLICPPQHLIGDDRKWMNLTIAMMTQAVGKPGKAKEVILLMDEFPALGYLPNLLSGLEQFREAGLRGHLIAQNPGQILQVYGQDGLRRLWGVSEYKQFFKVTDPIQAELISSWLGQVTVMSESVNAKGERTVSETGVPLIRPDELMQLRPD